MDKNKLNFVSIRRESGVIFVGKGEGVERRRESSDLAAGVGVVCVGHGRPPGTRGQPCVCVGGGGRGREPPTHPRLNIFRVFGHNLIRRQRTRHETFYRMSLDLVMALETYVLSWVGGSGLYYSFLL